MLSISSDSVNFEYVPSTHLKSILKLTNNSDSNLCFKLKVTTPKFYLVKPSKQTIKPHQTTTVQITLHKDGVPTCYNDKFKCFSKFTSHPSDEILVSLDKMNDVEAIKIPVVVHNLPTKYIKDDNRNSEVRSIKNHMIQSNNSSTTLEGMIAQKQQRVTNLTNQINKLKQNKSKAVESPKTTISFKSYLIILGMGLLVGVISSTWI